ncbi:MAG: excinuclease ABC subunit UvrC [Bacillota bacterium]|nr:excinuclease ABC subunit UvrC [Bacillota bacterium]
MKHTAIIEEQLALLPDLPGVYMMKDKDGEIIYVGKAKNLKNRVRSYFRGFDSHELKTQTLVVSIRDFDYIIADNETEALVLEANLIKRFQPRFNILLKDDKFYPYILITDEPFPRFFMSRNVAAYPNAKVFGPYTVAGHVQKLVEYLTTTYKLRECAKKIDGKSPRPCLNYFIGRCSAPCAGLVTEAEYTSGVALAEKVLKEGSGKLVRKVEAQMLEFAERLEFEKAAELRDLVSALKGVTIKQRVQQQGGSNQDYIAGYVEGDKACAMLFQYRDGKLIGREDFSFKGANNIEQAELLEVFVKQYYTGKENIPPEIYLSVEIEGMKHFESWFSELLGSRVSISVPTRGEKRKLVELVEKNAREYVQRFQNRIEREQEFAEKAQQELRALLGVGENLRLNRIEAFDISNTSGVHSVGSMVVFEHGKKKKSDYRRYRIKTVEGVDDYSSMQEVVFRRYRKQVEGLPMPDLVLIDGGKGHVHAVQNVMDALGLHIPVAGMVKDDFHKTEDLVYQGELLGLKSKKQAFKLLYSIQEEVHRFAIEYHKSLRSKEMLRSELDAIHGVGEKRKIALLKHFKNLESIAGASVEKLMECEGINRSVAEKIFQYFHNNE